MRVGHDFSTVSMDTWVHIEVVSARPRDEVQPVVQRALAWFDAVERVCTRFDPASEVMQLLHHPGQAVPVSRLLLEAAGFALELAALTDGAFDPCVGATLEQLGHDTHYKTQQRVRSAVDARATYRQVHLDRAAATLRVDQPLVLDLNAVAKGMAIDLAGQALAEFDDFCIEAGGDLYVHGHNAAGALWQVGIQHPRADGLIARTLQVTDTAVCTSGDYERGGHVLDGRSRQAASDLVSVTVLAPTAMAADGLSTAVMALGRQQGQALLESQGVQGLLIAADGAFAEVGA